MLRTAALCCVTQDSQSGKVAYTFTVAGDRETPRQSPDNQKRNEKVNLRDAACDKVVTLSWIHLTWREDTPKVNLRRQRQEWNWKLVNFPFCHRWPLIDTI